MLYRNLAVNVGRGGLNYRLHIKMRVIIRVEDV